MSDKIRKWFEFFTRHERYFFWLLILLYLVPVWMSKFFPTLDGPAHIYNANLLYQYGLHTSFLGQFYELNSNPEPNWIGHFILTFFTPIFPVNICEKLILSIYIILLPLSFRLLAKTINPHGKYTEYLIFPFVYGFTFYMGFYNFNLGICFFFFALAYWIRNENRLNWIKILIMSAFLILVYFSHVFIFALLCVTAGIYLTWNFLFDSYQAKQLFVQAYLRKTGILLLAALPGIVLTLNYVFRHANDDPAQYIAFGELIKWIKQIRPIIALNADNESPYSVELFYILFSLSLGIIAVKLFRIQTQRANEGVLLLPGKSSSIFNRQDVWLIVTVIVLILYFFLPDAMTNGGYVSARVCLFFFLMLMVWISSQRVSKWVAFPMILLALTVNGAKMEYYTEQSKLLSIDAEEFFSVEQKIEKNTTLMPLNYSDNWLHAHFSNYLGGIKPVMIFDNYEANNEYFPLIFKDAQNPFKIVNGFHHRPPCFEWGKYERMSGKKIDYVLTWRYRPEINDSCTVAIMKNIDSLYTKIFSSPLGRAMLYKRK